MKVTYTPEGAEPKTWVVRPKRMLSPECIAIEKMMGMSFKQWQDALLDNSITAQHALLYVLLKREQPTLTPDQVVFSPDELAFDADDEEAAKALEGLKGLPEAEQAEYAEVIAELEARLGGSDPKDSPSTSKSGSSTKRRS